MRHVASGLELNITFDAERFYDEWYLNLEKSVHTRRLDTYALRLMGLLAVNELKTIIDYDVVQMATILAEWQLEVRRVLDPIDAENSVARMEESIRRALGRNGALPDRKLRQFSNSNRCGLWVYHMARTNLQKSREIAFSSKKNLWYLSKV